MKILKKLYNYTDYRTFMKDYFAEMKRMKDFFSFRYFAGKAGFKAPNFCYYVINGTRNLSNKSAKKVIAAMGLKGRSAAYFEVLVQYNQTDDIKEKKELYKKLEILRKSSSIQHINKNKQKYVSHWYYPVIRELVVYSDWNNDYAKLASMVYPSITKSEAIDAVRTLEKLGLIVKKKGSYIQNESFVSIDEIPPTVKQKIRQEILFRGLESLEKFPIDKRYAAYSTIAITENEYLEITQILSEMRKRVVMESDTPRPEKIYQLVLQLFPVGVIKRNGEQYE